MVVSDGFLPPRLRAVGHIAAWSLVILLLLLLATSAWIAVRGALAYQHLARIQSGAATSVTLLVSNPSEAVPTVARLASDAAAARELTSDPVWALAQHMPWVGPQLAAFGTVARASDELLTESLLPLATAAQGLSVDSLKPTNGRINVGALGDLAAPADQAADRAVAAASELRGVDRTPLLGKVGTAVEQADQMFSGVSAAVDGVARTAELLPAMLGQDGPRNYLVLVQNNSEWRSLGGITGTAILLHTDQGSVSLKDTQSATGLVRDLQEPIMELPNDVVDIYGTRPARYFHNLTQIPDFTLDGPIAREMYRSKTGVNVDGVIAVDPVVLSYLLGATGPVMLPTGDRISAENAVPFLLNDVYLRYAEPSAQDAVFAGAAGAVFQGLLDGHGSVSDIVKALGRAGSEHRLLLWSADEQEQARIADTSIAGKLPLTDTTTARFGVFLNDGTGSKMSYYVRPDVSLEWRSCQSFEPVDRRSLTLRVTLTNTAPANAGATLPDYITGGGAYGTVPGDAKVVANLFLPTGSGLAYAESTDGSTFEDGQFEGRQVLTFGVELSPGESTSIEVRVSPPATTEDAEAVVTPTADATLAPFVRSSC